MKTVQLLGLLTLAFSFCLPEIAIGQQNHHPIVPAFERFIDVEDIDDLERGQLLLNELNCSSCHSSAEPSWSVDAKQAPILSEIGSRSRPEYLINYLVSPHRVKPGTTMPDVLAGYSSTERKRIAVALGHFLASTGKTSDTPPLPGPVANGKKLFHTIGCVACHNPMDPSAEIETSVPLPNLADKYTIPSLTEFLQNPLKVRPSGRMPHLGLNSKEAQEIASYLLKNIKLQANVNVAIYHGSWDELPDFDKLEPVSTGTVPVISANVAGRKENFGLVFSGFWEVTRKGKYDFRISSDDGSRLLIDGKEILNNDGVHPNRTESGSLQLDVGIHEVRIEYFEKGGEEVLQCQVNGPGLPRQSMSGILKSSKEPPMDEDRFVLNKSLVEKGAEYFVSVGCANCHELNYQGKTLESTLVNAPALTELAAGGCLESKGKTPRYGFTGRQVDSIKTALSATKPEVLDGKTRIHQRFATLNCYACHERNFVGGVVDRRGESDEIYGREKWFVSDQPEMGDEGRLPPLLNGVGSKLNPTWLEQVLDNNAKERPYMATRMPKFGKANLGSLVLDLQEEDKLTDLVQVEFSQPVRKVKNIGKAFAGTSEKDNGLSCVKCHTFGKYKATGIQALSLTSMHKRLNRDWFLKYMLKPSRYRPGTRMPESWPGGKSFFPDVLDGDANQQIAAIWEYLADGEKAAKPKGLIQAKMQLVATDVPRIYRNFIQGAGSRAIGIGYPAELNLAFDANNSRLAMIWTGSFIDASRHWTGRGQGYQPPLGDNVLKLPEGASFSTPELAADGWPKEAAKELGIRFKGYTFNTARQPSFKYEINDVKITDFPEPKVVDDRGIFVRQFQLKSTETKQLWFLAATGQKIKEISPNTFDIGGDYQIKLSGDFQTEIRASGNRQELILKLKLDKGRAEFTQQYIW